MIAIIDYGSGNLAAIANVYRRLGIDHKIVSDCDELRAAERYVLPGVGAFDVTMEYLESSGMLKVLNEEIIGKGKKVLGVCVGMQILGESSDEGVRSGLGWIKGRVRRIPADRIEGRPKLPHMGWNSIRYASASPLFEGVDAESGFYFLHSYYFDAQSADDVLATVDYGISFPCALSHGNVYGMQFHPEKSHANGVAVFRNFADL